MTIRHGYANVGSVRLHYAECGDGERLVILLHGFPECWYSWRHQLIALGNRYHVVAPDLRGYNLSDKPRQIDEYRIELLVEDVLGLMRHFGVREAAVVGHDWGAIIAWAVAQRHLERVWKLVAMQVPPMATWRSNMTLKQAIKSWYMIAFQIHCLPEWLLRMGNFAAVEWAIKTTIGHSGTFTGDDIAFYKGALSKPFALTAAINYYRANVSSMFMRSNRTGIDGSMRERIRVPTLFIYGDQDPFIVSTTVRNVSVQVDAPYKEVRIRGCAHWVQNEAPEAVNAALGKFLDAD
jgi:pimeloyl-ACP methyl ester carboxylesterase